MDFSLSQNLKKFSSACQSSGGKLFIVGGYVRNVLLSIPAYDIDICSSFSTEKIIEIVETLGWNHKLISKKLGTVKIIAGSESYEHTTFRKDTYANDGGHSPEHVEFINDIKCDALRRDFTANAIYYDIKENKIIDFFGGVKDIKKRQLKIINNDVFKVDGLRILRLIRFATTLEFTINKKTLSSAIKNRHQLKDISKERVVDEFEKMTIACNHANTKTFLQLLKKFECFKYIIPATANLQIHLKHFKFYDAPCESRYTAFCMTVLASYFDYQLNTKDQIIFACHKIFGNDGLSLSNRQIADIFSTYIILQYSFVKNPTPSLELICDYFNTSEEIKNFLRGISPSITTLLDNEVDIYKAKNIPLNESQLDITNIELLIRANIENKYVSKIKQILFNLCLEEKIINEKTVLLETAEILAKNMN